MAEVLGESNVGSGNESSLLGISSVSIASLCTDRLAENGLGDSFVSEDGLVSLTKLEDSDLEILEPDMGSARSSDTVPLSGTASKSVCTS